MHLLAQLPYFYRKISGSHGASGRVYSGYVASRFGFTRHLRLGNGACLRCVSFIWHPGCAGLKIIGCENENRTCNNRNDVQHYLHNPSRHSGATVDDIAVDHFRYRHHGRDSLFRGDTAMNKLCDIALIGIFGVIAIGCVIWRMVWR